MTLVPNQKVKVKWTNSYSKYYQELGYPKLKQGEEFEINAIHALHSNQQTIKVICDECHEEYELSIKQFYKNREKNNSLDVCNNCLSKRNYCKCECKNCGKEFKITIYRKNRGEGKFCSKECYDEFQNKKVETKCANCGKIIFKKPSLIKNKNFCSVICANQYFNNERKTIVKLNCKNCGNEYEVKKSKENTSHFCSRKCQAEWTSKNLIGENSSKYKERILIKCEYCKKYFFEEEYKLNLNQKHFCCKECKDAYHEEIFIQSDEFKEKMRILMVNRLSSNVIQTVNTKPQIIINKLLNELGIKFINEKSFKYYSMDNYLPENNTAIEVMGDYWHSNPLKYTTLESLNKMQRKVIGRDKAKRTYIQKYYGIKILYLWEKDIVNNIEKCKRIILNYFEHNGMIDVYNSFNYSLYNDRLVLNEKLITPYFMIEKII